MDKKEKYICISLNSVIKGILITVVLVAAVFVLLLPRTDLFKGSLIQTNGPKQEQNEVGEVEAGSIVVEYLKETDEVTVQSGSKGVSLGKFAFKPGIEPVELSAITLEMEGSAGNREFENLSLNFNGNKVENADFMWVSESSLFIDLVDESLKVTDYGEIELISDISVEAKGKKAGFHFVEVIAKGETSMKGVTNVGLNGTLDPVPLFINFK